MIIEHRVIEQILRTLLAADPPGVKFAGIQAAVDKASDGRLADHLILLHQQGFLNCQWHEDDDSRAARTIIDSVRLNNRRRARTYLKSRFEHTMVVRRYRSVNELLSGD